MTYTSHGLMTPTDRADHDALYDTGRNPECPGHDNEDNTALVYCSRAENCPDADEEAEGWGPPPGLEPM